jgi:predicted MFS family arabinose efflux permease
VRTAATTRSERVARAGFGAALLIGMTVSTFMMAALGALGPLIRDDLDISRSALGALTTVMFAIGALLSPVAGRAVDDIGGRRLLVAMFVVAGGCFAAAAATPNYFWLLVVMALMGLPVAAGNPSTNKLLAERIPLGGQGVITGVKQSGVQVGVFLAGAVLPIGAVAFGWRGMILASVVLPIAGLVLTRLFVPADDDRPARAERPRAGPLGPIVLPLSAYAFLMGTGVAAFGAYLPLYARESLGMSVSAAGSTVALSGLVGIGARIAWGRAAEHHLSTPAALAIIGAGSVLAQASIWAAESVGTPLLWVGALLIGVSAGSWNAVGMLEIVKGMDASAAGRASGAVLLAFYAGYVTSPIAFGYSVDRTGEYDLGWGAVLAIYCLATLLAAAWARSSR